jgi:hypothetical protein
MMVQADSLRVVVSSDHPEADERVAEAIARVLSRYAVDYTSGVEVNVPHDGMRVSYQARTRPRRLPIDFRGTEDRERHFKLTKLAAVVALHQRAS